MANNYYSPTDQDGDVWDRTNLDELVAAFDLVEANIGGGGGSFAPAYTGAKATGVQLMDPTPGWRAKIVWDLYGEQKLFTTSSNANFFYNGTADGVFILTGHAQIINPDNTVLYHLNGAINDVLDSLLQSDAPVQRENMLELSLTSLPFVLSPGQDVSLWIETDFQIASFQLNKAAFHMSRIDIAVAA